jgi:small conductance mechanosensitive channel
VDLAVRVWVLTDDYNDMFFDLNERVYVEFESVGLRFPFPQLDVHLKNQV